MATITIWAGKTANTRTTYYVPTALQVLHLLPSLHCRDEHRHFYCSYPDTTTPPPPAPPPPSPRPAPHPAGAAATTPDALRFYLAQRHGDDGNC